MKLQEGYHIDTYTKKYIRNRDRHHFKKSEKGQFEGAILTKYYGTLRKAWEKGVPVYNYGGKLTHKPSLKANPKRL